MRYEISIRSHTDAPDYEDNCEAQSKDEAAREFSSRITRSGGEYWAPEDLLKYISE